MVLAVNDDVDALTLSLTTIARDCSIVCYNWPCLAATATVHINLRPSRSLALLRLLRAALLFTLYETSSTYLSTLGL
eukprot:scaffold3547_cov110-Isochrysis_galbana.AAC.1